MARRRHRRYDSSALRTVAAAAATDTVYRRQLTLSYALSILAAAMLQALALGLSNGTRLLARFSIAFVKIALRAAWLMAIVALRITSMLLVMLIAGFGALLASALTK